MAGFQFLKKLLFPLHFGNKINAIKVKLFSIIKSIFIYLLNLRTIHHNSIVVESTCTNIFIPSLNFDKTARGMELVQWRKVTGWQCDQMTTFLCQDMDISYQEIFTQCIGNLT